MESIPILLLTSVEVVTTGVEFNISAILTVKSFAPPKCPLSRLITKFALSSISKTAGSDSFEVTCGAIYLIIIPDAIIPIMQSYLSNIESTVFIMFL